MPDERRDGYDIGERAERMAQYPLAAAAGAEIFAHYEERFEDGPRLIVAGIEARYGVALIAGRAGRPDPPPSDRRSRGAHRRPAVVRPRGAAGV
ncbi:TetR/AcrR family transcriptional regulator C-terminal domain-containing protein [Streptomyces sp. 900116325]